MNTTHAGGRVAARAATGGAILVIGIGLSVLAGWTFDVEALMTVLPGSIRMKPNTAIGLIAAAATLLLEKINAAVWLRRLLASIPFAAGSVTLVEYVTRSSFGVDELLFRDPANAFPGRMGHLTAANFVLIGVALLCISARPRWTRLTQVMTLGSGLLSLFVIVGYLYGVPVLYGATHYTSMALHTSVSFLLLSLGALFVHPDIGLAAQFWSRTSGGVVARKLVPLAIVVPIVLGAGFVRPQLNFGEMQLGFALSVMTSVVSIVALILSLSRSLSRAERDSVVDVLTRAYNRRYFDLQLELEMNRSARAHAPLSLILFDMDHFKKVNDEHGHVTGDAVLQWVAGVIRPTLRRSETFCRYGGEEFAVIVPNAGLRETAVVAERIRNAVANAPGKPENLSLTISAGVAELHGGDTPRSLVHRADEALYLAKKNGRNRVESFRAVAHELRLVLAAAN